MRTRIFYECGGCGHGRVLVSIVLPMLDGSVNKNPPLQWWICKICSRGEAERMREAILTCNVCGTIEHSTTQCPVVPSWSVSYRYE